jgi:hypothetical protein
MNKRYSLLSDDAVLPRRASVDRLVDQPGDQSKAKTGAKMPIKSIVVSIVVFWGMERVEFLLIDVQGTNRA